VSSPARLSCLKVLGNLSGELSKSCTFLSSRLFFWPSRQFRIQNPRMNVHCGGESDRVLWQEASCLSDDPAAAAPERETNSLTASALQSLAYPLGPRSDECLDQEESTTSLGPTRRESMRSLKESVRLYFERCWIITKLVSSIVLMASLFQTLEIHAIISALTLTSTLSDVKI